MIAAERVLASNDYPARSPLPRGENADLAYVAEETGSYALRVRGAGGAYTVDVDVRRPGTETSSVRRQQTVVLDFDGGAYQAETFGIWPAGERRLTPLSAYLASWNLSPDSEPALRTAIVREVRENLRTDLLRRQPEADVTVRIVDAADHDLYGRPNVSRVLVGGTRGQSSFIAKSAEDIDPGNFDTQDQAMVLLDDLAAAGARPTGAHGTKVLDGAPYSINTYLESSSDRTTFVAQALGNVISQRIGQLVGVYPTDPDDSIVSLSDYAGSYPEGLFGVGPDGIGGTADDIDVDFLPDAYAPDTRLKGLQNSPAVAAWGLTKPLG